MEVLTVINGVKSKQLEYRNTVQKLKPQLIVQPFVKMARLLNFKMADVQLRLHVVPLTIRLTASRNSVSG